MNFQSVLFLFFYIIVLACIRLVPDRIRKYVLLTANLCFYASNGIKFVPVLLLISALAYFLGLLSLKVRLGSVGNIFNYAGILTIIMLLLVHISGISYPLGLSFYSLMAAGYVMEVSKDGSKVIRSYGDLFTCLSFFPIIQSGPIEKANDILPYLSHPCKNKNDGYAFLSILWGLLEKAAISNIAYVYVNEVFDNYSAHSFVSVILATLLYAFELYADFDGYSHIAYGCASLLGIPVMNNFRQPYLSVSIRDFWKRWHISLSTWLKDYVYIPLGGSRKGKMRKYINLMLTFILSGIWHGTGLNFLVWGMLHGIYQVLEYLLPAPRHLRRFITFLLVDFAWFFFRVNSLYDAYLILSGKGLSGFCGLSGLLSEASASGLNSIHFAYMAVALIFLIVSDILRYRNHNLYERYTQIPTALRFIICYAMIFAVIVSALSICKFDMAGFIYGNF